MTLRRSTDPIIAIATAPGRGAVGIVRVSAPALGGLIEAVCGRSLVPRHATYLRFHGADGQPIDQGLALHFPAPHSYTGEDVLELQVHGGAVVLQLLLARCLEAAAQLDPVSGAARLPNLRLAEPGEFTLRAFLNDKLDLAQAEAVADLIDAGTEASARSAARSLAGAFSVEVDLLRQRIVTLRMLVEATLDFPDEEIDFLQQADALGKLDAIVATLAGVLERARQGALLREGLQVVLAGQPNVGKSSLLNALAGAELAIVTAIPGTTRDKVSQTIQIEGVPLHVVDTAGLRDIGNTPGVDAAGAGSDAGTGAGASIAASNAVRRAEPASDEVERIGIARSWEAIGQADAVIFVHDLTRRGQPDYEAAEAAIAARLQPGELDGATRTGRAQGSNGTDAPRRMPRIVHVHNKVDALPAGAAARAVPAAADVVLSARTGAGLDALRRALLQCVGWHATLAEGVFIARQRHVDALQRTRAHLCAAQVQAAQGAAALDLLAEELRLAHDALAEITGAFSSDDLLGEIFGRFCIGK